MQSILIGPIPLTATRSPRGGRDTHRQPAADTLLLLLLGLSPSGCRGICRQTAADTLLLLVLVLVLLPVLVLVTLATQPLRA